MFWTLLLISLGWLQSPESPAQGTEELRARFYRALAAGDRPTARGCGRQLADRLRPGDTRRALEALVTSLQAGARSNQRQDAAPNELVARAALHRSRGDARELQGMLTRLAADHTCQLLTDYALGELAVSPGTSHDLRRARRCLERFLGSSQSDTRLLQLYVGRRSSLSALRSEVRRWLVALAAGDRPDPPPFVDRRHWQRQLREARARTKRERSRVVQLDRRLQRLQGQFATVGDLRRKDGRRNRLEIRYAIRRLTAQREKAGVEISRSQRVAAHAERLLASLRGAPDAHQR